MTTLPDRLRQHAALHNELADDEQQQWGRELLEASAEIERLQSALTESALQVLAHSTQAHEAWQDACRYRWLRATWGFSLAEELFGAGTSRHPEAELDAAIDAARKGAP